MKSVSSPLFLSLNAVKKKRCGNFPTSTTQFKFIYACKLRPPPSISSSSWSCSFRVNCSSNSYDGGGDNSNYNSNSDSDEPLTLTPSSAYAVLGLDPQQCSYAQLKSAFRTKVKQLHPDVTRGGYNNSDFMIRRVIQAYQLLSNYTKSEIIERECMDPFDEPECEAADVFVNQVLCIGKGCPYSCVNMAPHAFKLSSVTGTAEATCQGHGEDYKVQIAVGQCPRNCIHYVTPSQRIILEELLQSIIGMPYDTSAEAELLYSLIVKAKYENNRYQRPKSNSN
ncbi:hypothetical protein ABFS82_02G097000 [Erythranthe guttata]|uniref:J domain-containing protein n=1 Tax=Erythranthe guttata TaxID=4155 RepID=A0A022Q3B7_ERYGU|nr:PREDICTED: uncharacterized protein LOC105976386 [Erythranthe guttata]EYU20985.1 hypothetical protein MIMGU_mgv1a011470mg [Erythranthe guttata]|eukprot:XP_012857118.1 PREDICTED: uncharacterized protein LOC105976386 [Erythranthe guttata]